MKYKVGDLVIVFPHDEYLQSRHNFKGTIIKVYQKKVLGIPIYQVYDIEYEEGGLHLGMPAKHLAPHNNKNKLGKYDK